MVFEKATPSVVTIKSLDNAGIDPSKQVWAKNNGAPKGQNRLILPGGREVVV